MQHEAGHFLIAYLVGILPRGYTLTSLDALKKEGSLNIQAGTAFVDFEFLEEVGCFLQYFPLSCCCIPILSSVWIEMVTLILLLIKA